MYLPRSKRAERALVCAGLAVLVGCGSGKASPSGASSTSGSGAATTTSGTGGLGVGGAPGSSSGTGGTGGAFVTTASSSTGAGGGDACSTLIDFETVPGGMPQDGMTIDTQYQAMFGVSFGLDKDGDGKPDPGAAPVLAKVGDPATAFIYDATGQGDTAAPGQNIGMFFLTDDGMIAGPPSPLVITYSTEVAAAYGQIIDIDGQEGWTIEARDASNVVAEKVVINAGDPGTGDGIATPFSFKHTTADIASIRLVYTGTAKGAVGLAFDNFSPACAMPTIK